MHHTFIQQAQNLVQRMTLEEMLSQLRHDAPAIPRLGIPAYNWWNEALHGVARGGTATMFPQAIGLGATFHEELLFTIAEVIATEQRAKYNLASAQDDRGIYKGLTVWSPNINIFRDPRWGRGQETYGEDPFLTARLAVAFIKGLQGEGPYLKTAACVKHLAAHSGPEALRHSFNAVVSPKDMAETYLPAFEAAVKEAGVDAVMGAYSSVNGEPSCGSPTLIEDLLRQEWGFEGMYISDCWAIKDFHLHHKVTTTAEESAAMALNAGCDLNCGCEYKALGAAYEQGLISLERVKEAAVRVFTTRFHLGLFADTTPFSKLGIESIDTENHAKLAYEASCQSLVLLKNDGLLPLQVSSIAVIGPNAESRSVLKGNYHGTTSRSVTVLEGIRRSFDPSVRILYSEGSALTQPKVERLAENGDRLSEAVAFSQNAEVTLLCLGLDGSVEGEMRDDGNGGWAGDKHDLRLPACQRDLLKAVAATGKPIILLLLSGGALDPEIADYPNVKAVIQGWYPGQEGGLAIADLLLGRFSPSGRLPVTFYKAEANLPPFTEYAMKGRTYRYCNSDDVLYPFGFGLSYTTFAYHHASAQHDSAGNILLQCTLTNTGGRTGREVVQVYASHDDEDLPSNPVLCAIKSIELEAGKQTSIRILLDPNLFVAVDKQGNKKNVRGTWHLSIGGSQPDPLSLKLGSAPVARCTITL